jgi:hypothetical protein
VIFAVSSCRYGTDAQADCPTEIALKQGRIVRGLRQSRAKGRSSNHPISHTFFDATGAIAGDQHDRRHQRT